MPLDPKLATALVGNAIKRVASQAAQSASGFIRDRDNRCYAEYLCKRHASVNAVRNFIYDKQSAKLLDIYVHPEFRTRTVETDDDLIRKLHENPGKRTRLRGAYVVTGAAGSGKSLLLRYAFLRSQHFAHVPLLVEMRSFNSVKLADVETRIQEELARHDVAVSLDQIRFGLRIGLFTLLFDGFDELKGVIQEHYEQEIQRVAQSYPQCPILVSSRPMPRYQSWELFETREISNMSLKQIDTLISKLEFDPAVKMSFLNEVKAELIETHDELVRNPLLCTVMLLTFSDAGRISRDRPEFFEDAFNALWSKHDARKLGSFERVRATSLKKADFLRLTGAFSASSYQSSDYEIRESSFSKHFDKARRLTAVQCDEEDYLTDLTVSTSLAYKEGAIFAFRHRSFQEYFTAIFLGSVGDEQAFSLIEEFSDRWQTDSVLSLLLALNERLVERNWVMVLLTDVAKKIRRTRSLSQYARLATDEEDPIGLNMCKIRALYELEPSSDQLEAAYHAARGMDVQVEDDPRMVKLFEVDRENFLQLRDALSAKYATGRSALDELLS